MSPDSLPSWWPIVALALWLALFAMHRRDRRLIRNARALLVRSTRCTSVVGQCAEDSTLDDHVEQQQRDSEDDERDDERGDIHARIVSCPHLSRLDRLDGITRCWTCEP